MDQLLGPGFALRVNGSCPINQANCGVTHSPYRACCPLQAPSCPHQYNTDCCASSRNCTNSLLKNPQCANRTWNLYDNNGYFCCERGFTGYAVVDANSDGCAPPGHVFSRGERSLRPVSLGQVATSTSAPTSRPTNSPTSSPSSGSSTNTGAIAGGVVGGVLVVVIGVAVAWCLVRRRKTNAAKGSSDSSSLMPGFGGPKPPAVPQHELASHHNAQHELESRPSAVQLAERNEYSELAA